MVQIAEVTSALGNNGALAPVIASDSTGLFIAQPVSVGLLDPAQMPVAFSVVLYDQAMNRAVGTVNGNFTQVGAVGPGAALPGNATIDVEVVDDRSLAPIANAKVFVHEDNGGVFTLVDNDVTSAAGKVDADRGGDRRDHRQRRRGELRPVHLPWRADVADQHPAQPQPAPSTPGPGLARDHEHRPAAVRPPRRRLAHLRLGGARDHGAVVHAERRA
jgi:hypothetical protein